MENAAHFISVRRAGEGDKRRDDEEKDFFEEIQKNTKTVIAFTFLI